MLFWAITSIIVICIGFGLTFTEISWLGPLVGMFGGIGAFISCALMILL